VSRYTVEFLGIPRQLAGAREVELELPPGATLLEAVAALRKEVPALVGRVIAEDGTSLIEPYALNLNGRAFVQGLDIKLSGGDRIVLMTRSAGG
jgi:molybdopterin converting factor small subunit